MNESATAGARFNGILKCCCRRGFPRNTPSLKTNTHSNRREKQQQTDRMYANLLTGLCRSEELSGGSVLLPSWAGGAACERGFDDDQRRARPDLGHLPALAQNGIKVPLGRREHQGLGMVGDPNRLCAGSVGKQTLLLASARRGAKRYLSFRGRKAVIPSATIIHLPDGKELPAFV